MLLSCKISAKYTASFVRCSVQGSGFPCVFASIQVDGGPPGAVEDDVDLEGLPLPEQVQALRQQKAKLLEESRTSHETWTLQLSQVISSHRVDGIRAHPLF
jgi:hypothetical protein